MRCAGITNDNFCLSAHYQDILINNAAQTLTRPEAWTVKMYSLEEDAAKQLEDRPGGKSAIKLLPPPHVGMPTVANIEDTVDPDLEHDPEPEATHVPERPGSGSVDESQQQTTATTGAAGARFAVARALDGSAIVMDESGQPLDLSVRTIHCLAVRGITKDWHNSFSVQGVNSWSRRLGEVSTSELLQTMAVNAAAPFVLCSRLKPLLSWRGADESARQSFHQLQMT